MVQDKGIPSLCICGGNAAVGSAREVEEATKGKKKAALNHACASNCQFYKNEKDYERALRDILACTN
jgi:hypothetical protein